MLFDGAVTGKLVECDPNKKLVYEWRQTAWCPADVSKCTIGMLAYICLGMLTAH